MELHRFSSKIRQFFLYQSIASTTGIFTQGLMGNQQTLEMVLEEVSTYIIL
jgi:hypothetical protein